MRRLIVALLVVQAEVLAWHLGAAGHVSPMAVVLIEGFDHLAASQLTAKGWSANAGSMTTATRFGDGQAALISNSTKPLPSTYTTLIAGVAVNPSGFAANEQFLRFLTNAGGVVAALRFNAAGKLEVINSSATIIATGTTVLAVGNWYYVELKIVVNGAAGSCEVHLEGATEIAATTGNFGSTAIGQVQLESGNAPSAHAFDDLYAVDTSGPAPRNTFLGDVRVKTIYPAGAGAHSDFTPNGATPNYACVNEATPDGDTTYVSDGTPGDFDTYAFDDVDGGATVFAVQFNLYARKDDAAARQIARVVRQAGADYVGGTLTLGASYAVLSQLDNQDPTGADWTPANVNADEFGVKEIA